MSAASPAQPADDSPDVEPARPFVKWAGGKRQLLDDILPLVRGGSGTFHEPFVGGGAVFFALRPQRAVLSDQNLRLVRAYRGIKNAVEDVIALLDTYPRDKAFYLNMRGKPVDSLSDTEVAAWLIFLNKTCFNGLYRVNSRNEFNVPFGDNAHTRVSAPKTLRACSAALAEAEVHHEDFAAVLLRAKPGDTVYFDPPYVPLSLTSAFRSYTADGFTMDDQVRLRDTALALKARGVRVVLSNSSAPAVQELYADFKCFPVSASRRVNRDSSKRGAVTELLIT